MPTIDDGAKAAFIAYYGKSIPVYGPNDPVGAWEHQEEETKAIWKRVAVAVIRAAQARNEGV